jgi:hypothetical protein
MPTRYPFLMDQARQFRQSAEKPGNEAVREKLRRLSEQCEQIAREMKKAEKPPAK